MAQIPGVIPFTGLIGPKDDQDTYPIIDPQYGIDGIRNVDSIQARNQIPQPKRRVGMIVGVKRKTDTSPETIVNDTDGNPIIDLYQLVNEPGNTNTSDLDWNFLISSDLLAQSGFNSTQSFEDGSTQFQAAIIDMFRGRIDTLFEPQNKVIDDPAFTDLIIGPVDIEFNNDGTKAFILVIYTDGVNTSDLYEYTLSTPWNIGTATATGVEYSMNGLTERTIKFSDDGTRLYGGNNTGDEINQYNLSTPFDLSTISYQTSITTQSSTVTSLEISNDGTKLFETENVSNVSGNLGVIYEYELSTPYEISSASFTGVTKNGLDDNLNSIAFNDDGTMLFECYGGTKIYGYNLSAPFDITTANIDNDNTLLISRNANNFVFGNNGRLLYSTNRTTNIIFSFSLNVSYDLTTASYNGTAIKTKSDNPQSITMHPNGSIFYELDADQQSIHQIDLTYPYDFLTATYQSNINTQDADPQGIFINKEGTKLYEIGNDSNLIYQYNLSTTFDLSTASYTGNNISIQGDEACDINFRIDGKKMYELSRDSGSPASNSTIYEYDLDTAWDITTANYNGNTYSMQDGTSYSFSFRPDGKILYELAESDNTIYEHILIEPWNISSAVYANKFKDLVTSDVTNILVTYDLTKLIYISNDTGIIHEGLLGLRVSNKIVIRGDGTVFQKSFINKQVFDEGFESNAVTEFNDNTYGYGTNNLGFGDKSWQSTGLESDAKWEFYRSTDSAQLLIHQSDGSNNSVLWLRTNSKDYTIENNGTALLFYHNNSEIARIDENGVFGAEGNYNYNRTIYTFGGNVSDASTENFLGYNATASNTSDVNTATNISNELIALDDGTINKIIVNHEGDFSSNSAEANIYINGTSQVVISLNQGANSAEINSVNVSITSGDTITLGITGSGTTPGSTITEISVI